MPCAEVPTQSPRVEETVLAECCVSLRDKTKTQPSFSGADDMGKLGPWSTEGITGLRTPRTLKVTASPRSRALLAIADQTALRPFLSEQWMIRYHPLFNHVLLFSVFPNVLISWPPKDTSTPRTSQFLEMKKIYKQETLGRVWRKGNLAALTVGMWWYSHCGKQYGGSLKTKNRTNIWPSNLTPGHIPWGNHNQKEIHTPNIHCSAICNRQDIEVT